jgi:DNA-binding MarR family transcriptional regulator
MTTARKPRDRAAPDVLPTAADDPIVEHVRSAVETWPQIDPEVEGVVSRIEKVEKHLQGAFRESLGKVGLTKEEWKVLMKLYGEVRSHGWLSRELEVATGAMTNRLDKLERRGLVKRARDPGDRRGVLLELTPAGRKLFDEYISVAAARESELVAALSLREQRQLNGLLSKLLVAMVASEHANPRSH